jgi:hypothetical protein
LARSPSEPVSFVVQPPLEFWRGINKEARQQISAVEIQCLRCITALQSLIKSGRIAPQNLRRRSHLAWAATHDHVAAKRPPQEVRRLVQSPPRTLLISLGPEEGKSRISPPEGARSRKSQINQQGQPFRLLKDRLKALIIGPNEIKSPEQRESDH